MHTLEIERPVALFTPRPPSLSTAAFERFEWVKDLKEYTSLHVSSKTAAVDPCPTTRSWRSGKAAAFTLAHIHRAQTEWAECLRFIIKPSEALVSRWPCQVIMVLGEDIFLQK
jgi:hypothetical protein